MSVGTNLIYELKSNISILDEINVLLRDAIDEQDWNLVVEAYLLLTGEELDAPKTPDNPGDILSELMSRMSKLEGKETSQKPKSVKTVEEIGPIIPTKSARSKKNVHSTNKFDEMTDLLSEVGKESGFKKINDKVKPIKRSRKPYRPAKVVCIKCKKTFEINPVLAKDNYQCDDCIGS